MNWEAAGVIGLGVGVPCAVLLLIALFFSRRWRKTHPTSAIAARVPAKELGIQGAIVVLAFGGLTVRIWAPDSALSDFVSAPSGQLTFIVLVFIGLGVLRAILAIFCPYLRVERDDKAV